MRKLQSGEATKNWVQAFSTNISLHHSFSPPAFLHHLCSTNSSTNFFKWILLHHLPEAVCHSNTLTPETTNLLRNSSSLNNQKPIYLPVAPSYAQCNQHFCHNNPSANSPSRSLQLPQIHPQTATHARPSHLPITSSNSHSIPTNCNFPATQHATLHNPSELPKSPNQTWTALLRHPLPD